MITFNDVKKQSEIFMQIKQQYLDEFSKNHKEFEIVIEELKLRTLLMSKWEKEYLGLTETTKGNLK